MSLSSRVHRMNPEDVIIEQRGIMNWRHHLRDAVLTILLWAFLLWLWQPALQVFFWYMDLAVAYEDRDLIEGLTNLKQLTWFYLAVIGIICCTFYGWALLQQWRFRKHVPQKAAPGLSNEQIATWFGVDPDTRQLWTRLRNANVYFDAENQTLTLRMRDTEDEEDASYDQMYTSPVSALEVLPESQEYYMDFRPEHLAADAAAKPSAASPDQQNDDEGRK